MNSLAGLLIRCEGQTHAFGGRRETGCDAVVQREIHPQPGILRQNLRFHFRGVLRSGDIRIPVGNVFLHELNRPHIARSPRPFVSRDDNGWLQSCDLVDGLVPVFARFIALNAEIDVIENNIACHHCFERRDKDEAVARTIAARHRAGDRKLFALERQHRRC